MVSTMYAFSLFGFDRGFDFFEDFDLLSEKESFPTVDAENIIDTALSWFGKQSQTNRYFCSCTFAMCTMRMKARLPLIPLSIGN